MHGRRADAHKRQATAGTRGECHLIPDDSAVQLRDEEDELARKYQGQSSNDSMYEVSGVAIFDVLMSVSEMVVSRACRWCLRKVVAKTSVALKWWQRGASQDAVFLSPQMW